MAPLEKSLATQQGRRLLIIINIKIHCAATREFDERKSLFKPTPLLRYSPTPLSPCTSANADYTRSERSRETVLRRGVFSGVPAGVDGWRRRWRRSREGRFIRTEKEKNYLNFAAEKLLAKNSQPVILLTSCSHFSAEIENYIFCRRDVPR